MDKPFARDAICLPYDPTGRKELGMYLQVSQIHQDPCTACLCHRLLSNPGPAERLASLMVNQTQDVAILRR